VLFDKRRIEREEEIKRKKLEAISREPPQQFHAPNGAQSIKARLIRKLLLPRVHEKTPGAADSSSCNQHA
jgi:hypothetical protein